MMMTFRCPQCGNSASTERRLAELCPCNQMDRSRPTLRKVLTIGLLIIAVVSPLWILTLQIPT